MKKETHQRENIIKVYCIEGVHGVGKTKIIEKLKRGGELILPEEFVQKKKNGLSDQGFTNEVIWAVNFISRIQSFCQKNGFSKPVYVDRSPYSSAIYSKSGNDLIKQVVDKSIDELSDNGIKLITVNLILDKETNWKRVMNRLKVMENDSEKQLRIKFKENDRDWFEYVYEFYKSGLIPWTYNMQYGKDESCDSICRRIKMLNTEKK